MSALLHIDGAVLYVALDDGTMADYRASEDYRRDFARGYRHAVAEQKRASVETSAYLAGVKAAQS